MYYSPDVDADIDYDVISHVTIEIRFAFRLSEISRYALRHRPYVSQIDVGIRGREIIQMTDRKFVFRPVIIVFAVVECRHRIQRHYSIRIEYSRRGSRRHARVILVIDALFRIVKNGIDVAQSR